VQRLNNKQNGMSGFGFGIVLVLLAVGTAIALKLLPIYIEHFNVVSILESLEKQEEKLAMDAIKPQLLRNFSINDVTNVGRQHIKVKRLAHNKKQVTIEYEVRRSVMGNVDVVVQFSDSVELTGP